jgi:hypothetical protein
MMRWPTGKYFKRNCHKVLYPHLPEKAEEDYGIIPVDTVDIRIGDFPRTYHSASSNLLSVIMLNSAKMNMK